MDTNLLLEGLGLMFLGMGIVFGFLTILVFTVVGMSALTTRFAAVDHVDPSTSSPSAIDVSDHRQVVAVIAAAVARYRAARGA
ncbi:MAG: OadG family protein [Chromatiaceae bacterium]|nr:OadG family protein [Chromatiaceae bacterium]HPE80218.1 OadG family transporter subunit [Gammaproteobacteria bacterium]